MKTGSEKTISLTLPADKLFITAAAKVAEEFMDINGMDADMSKRVQFGLEDILTELIEYQGGYLSNVSITVSYTAGRHGLEIKIRENGIPYDEQTMDRYSPEKDEDEGIEGIGIYYLKRFMDSVEFRNLGKEGREIIIKKHIQGWEERDAEPGIEEKTKGSQTAPVDYYVRGIRDSEAIELAKCVFFTYGYTYIYEAVYYPEKVTEMNRQGEMISVVAVTRKGEELMGHTALTFGEMENVAEMGVAFVYPKYRGMRCLETMTEALLEKARERGLEGVYVQAVTSHIFSQKAARRFGLRDTAILLLRITPMVFKAIKDYGDSKETLVISYLQIKKRVETLKYAPEKYKTVIEKIYRNLGFAADFARAGKVGKTGARASLAVTLDSYNTATIKVMKYGDDFEQAVKKHVKEICLNRIDSIYIYLPLAEHNTCYSAEILNPLGFFFAGIMPGNNGNDMLILQYLNNCRVSYEDIMLESDTAGEILKFIREEDPGKEI